MNTKDAAKGKWPGILRHFGVEEEYLANRHGPCPMCGGEDRYRFDDRNGNGDFYCNGCGPGDGFDILERLKGMDFAEACKAIDQIVGNITTEKPKEKPHDPKEAHEKNAAIWKATKPGALYVLDYLRRRGITVKPDHTVVRGHDALPYFHAGTNYGRIPAMVARVQGPDGRGQSLHRTYLPTDNLHLPARKKLTKAVETVTGGAVRLFPVAETMGVAEGIETALSCYQLTGIPTWSTISAGGLQAVELPSEVRAVVIFADNDINGRGQTAADALRIRLEREGRNVDVQVCPLLGKDWNDFLCEQQGNRIPR